MAEVTVFLPKVVSAKGGSFIQVCETHESIYHTLGESGSIVLGMLMPRGAVKERRVGWGMERHTTSHSLIFA